MSKSLWQSAISLGRMDQAWEKVRSNAGCAGGDKVSIRSYQGGAARRLTELRARLVDGSYRPGSYRAIDIPKPNGGVRRLMVPCVEDRIVHTALAQTLTPILEAMFSEASYAYRPGRSVKMAVQAIERWRKAGYWYVFEADIVGFFDNVRHELLLEKLEAALVGQVDADKLVSLVALGLEHLSAESGVAGRGVPQGSPLSPLLANLYLDALDDMLEQSGVRLVRFADDFVVLCKKRANADHLVEEVRELLATHGLELHAKGTGVVDFDRGFTFLGHLFVRSFALQQINDPEDDLVTLLRDIDVEDQSRALDQDTQEEAEKRERRAGYDRGAQVLYVIEKGRQLGLRNLSFAVSNADGREMAAIAYDRVDRIEVGTGVEVEPGVLEHALATETDFAFVTSGGETRGSLVTPARQNGALQLSQAQMCLDPEAQTQLARAYVEARIRNQRTQLFRLNREPQDSEVISALAQMGRFLRKLDGAVDVAALRGYEGAVGALYWPALGRLCKEAPKDMRRTRPAKDPLNASLNYLTALLERDVRAAILCIGLHGGFGTLHACQDRGEALVYDQMEPFRAPLNEGLVAFLFNARRLRSEMFTALPEGGVRIEGPARRALIKGYEQAVARRVKVTGGTSKLAWRAMMRHQARSLARAVRADDAALFQPYLMEP